MLVAGWRFVLFLGRVLLRWKRILSGYWEDCSCYCWWAGSRRRDHIHSPWQMLQHRADQKNQLIAPRILAWLCGQLSLGLAREGRSPIIHRSPFHWQFLLLFSTAGNAANLQGSFPPFLNVSSWKWNPRVDQKSSRKVDLLFQWKRKFQGCDEGWRSLDRRLLGRRRMSLIDSDGVGNRGWVIPLGLVLGRRNIFWSYRGACRWNEKKLHQRWNRWEVRLSIHLLDPPTFQTTPSLSVQGLEGALLWPP